MDNMLINGIDENFYNNIRNTILKARINIYKNINFEMVKSAWDCWQANYRRRTKRKTQSRLWKTNIKAII